MQEVGKMFKSDAPAIGATPTRWQTVMFDPLAYIHPDRFSAPPGFDTPAQRAAINGLLLAGYQLTSESSAAALPVYQSDAVKLVLKHWFVLPQIVFLLGCQRLRLALARRGAVLRLPVSAQAFLTLPLLQQVDRANEACEAGNAVAPNRDALMREGMRQLHLALGELPVAVIQRMALLFAPALDSVAATVANDLHDMRDPAHALTLTMAIQHVKRNPISAY
jgi:type III secretion system OrgA/MxiK family protein